MEYNGSSFFCTEDPDKGPKIFLGSYSPVNNSPWPISISINTNNSYNAPDISIHLTSELQLIALKNSIVWELERYRRRVYGR